MSRIQQILSKAERDGTARRLSTLARRAGRGERAPRRRTASASRRRRASGRRGADWTLAPPSDARTNPASPTHGRRSTA